MTDMWTVSKRVHHSQTFCGHSQSGRNNREGKSSRYEFETIVNHKRLHVLHIMTQNKVHLERIFQVLKWN